MLLPLDPYSRLGKLISRAEKRLRTCQAPPGDGGGLARDALDIISRFRRMPTLTIKWYIVRIRGHVFSNMFYDTFLLEHNLES